MTTITTAKTKKQLSDLLDKLDLCIANQTSNVVKKYRYDANCGDGCITSLHSLVLKKEALIKMYDCLTTEKINAIYESVQKECKDLCLGEDSQVASTVNDNYIVIGLENGNLLIQENNEYILV